MEVTRWEQREPHDRLRGYAAVYHSVLDQWRIVHAPVAVEQISLELPMISVNRTDNNATSRVFSVSTRAQCSTLRDGSLPRNISSVPLVSW